MKIGLIGFGNFGRLAASILSKRFKLLIYEPKANSELLAMAKRIKAKFTDFETAARCDVVILAAPISKTENIIREMAPLVKKGSLIIDTCSVKSSPVKWMKKYLPDNVSILGTHPMFGPYSSDFDFNRQSWELSGLKIALCPVRFGHAKLLTAKKFLAGLGLQTIITTPQEHDRQTAMSLAFVHFLGRSIKKAGIAEQEICTQGFIDVLKIYPHTNSDNWQLFYDMNNYNPYAKQAREKFMEACDFIDEKIEKSASPNELEQLRGLIDKTDVKIIEMLSKRFKYAKQIARLKRGEGPEKNGAEREKLIVGSRLKQAKADNKFVKKLYRIIFDESYKKQ